MKDYLWVFVLSVIALFSAGVFLSTIAKSSMLVNKLKISKGSLIVNFSLLILSLLDIGLIVYVFLLVKEQVSRMS